MFNSTKISKLDAELKAALDENEKLKAQIAALESGVIDLAAKAAEDEDEDAKKAKRASSEKDEDDDMEDEEDEKETSKKAKGKSRKAEYDEDEDEANAAIGKIAASITSLKGQISRLEKSIDARVSSTLASMGIEPIARDPKAKDNDNSTLSGLARASAGMRVAE
jgi:chromosome segregation ATPase